MKKNNKKKSKIMITGGHLTPALAILDELESRGYKNFVWVGRRSSQTGDKRKSSEYKVVRKRGIKFYNLRAGAFPRKWNLKVFFTNIKRTIQLPIGFLSAIGIVSKEKPNIIISFGGYLALPVVIAGKLFGKKIITHEQTVVSGLSNRLISKFADKILVSWEQSLKHFPQSKTVQTGNPIRKEVFKIQTNDFVFENELPITYVTGGAQGANTINWRLLEILPKVLKKTNIIHQTGSSSVTKDYEKALKKKKRLPGKLQRNYVVRKHIYGKQIGEIFNKSSLVISRAGANTMSELLALGKLSIIIPIPWSSGDEQTKNARFLEELGLATVIIQDELTPNLLKERILIMLEKISEGVNLDGNRLDIVRRAAKTKVNPNADKLIVDQIESLIR